MTGEKPVETVDILLRRIAILEASVRRWRDRASRQYRRAELWHTRATRKRK